MLIYLRLRMRRGLLENFVLLVCLLCAVVVRRYLCDEIWSARSKIHGIFHVGDKSSEEERGRHGCYADIVVEVEFLWLMLLYLCE